MLNGTKYSFEDWINGTIFRDFHKHEIDNFSYEKVKNHGWLPLELHKQGLIDKEEYLKIEQQQKDTFYKAVQISVESLFEVFKNRCLNSSESNKFLDHKIQKLESELEEVPNETMTKVYAGEWDRTGIDYLLYRKIFNETEKLSDQAISLEDYTITIGEDGEISTKKASTWWNSEYNELFDLTVKNNLLSKIRNLKEDNTSETPKTLPDPQDIAKRFKKQAKNKKTGLGVNEYTFVMNFARMNPEMTNVSALIRKIKNHPECPSKISEKKDNKAERKWIKFYDDHADIMRN